MSDRVTELENELHRLEAEIADCRRNLFEAQQEAAGIRIGDIVTFKGEPHKVVVLEFRTWLAKPWAFGLPKTKKGEWSRNRRFLANDWTKP